MPQPENVAHNASHGRRRAVVLIGVFAVWLVVASIGCSPMAVATHEGLKLMGVDSEIAAGTVANRTTYTHIFIIVDGQPYEPRFGGLVLLDHIDYDAHPRDRYGTTEEYLADGSLFPSTRLLADIAKERL